MECVWITQMVYMEFTWNVYGVCVEFTRYGIGMECAWDYMKCVWNLYRMCAWNVFGSIQNSVESDRCFIGVSYCWADVSLPEGVHKVILQHLLCCCDALQSQKLLLIECLLLLRVPGKKLLGCVMEREGVRYRVMWEKDEGYAWRCEGVMVWGRGMGMHMGVRVWWCDAEGWRVHMRVWWREAKGWRKCVRVWWREAKGWRICVRVWWCDGVRQRDMSVWGRDGTGRVVEDAYEDVRRVGVDNVRGKEGN